jgi:hypothetical protein
MYRQFLATLIILSLAFSPSLYAQEGAALSTPTPTPAKESDRDVWNKALDSNLTSQIVKRLGQPGFYVSKFLNFRKQLLKPVCTTSEQINRLSVLTSITGDLTTGAFDFFEGKKLQKKFADKLDSIGKYQDDLKKQNKKVLDFEVNNADLQLDTLKYLKGQAEIELKRAELVRVFVYTSLALSLTSKVVASMEGASEAASMGSLAAKAQACRVGKKTEEVANESKTAKFLESVKNKEVPWYFQPFLYLAKGIVAIESTDTYKTYKEYKNGLNEKKFASENPSIDSGSTSSVTSIAHSAAYAEEMIVDVVTDVIHKWKDGSRNAIDEINNFNKKDKDTSGIMKFFKMVGAEELAIRYAVRSLIRINAVEVDAFMTSGFGRFVMYAYNVYFYYKTIAENQAQVEYAKQKIEILDKTIKNFETKTTWIPNWNNFFNAIVPSAVASVPTQYVIPKPPCLQEIIPSCSLSHYNFITTDVVPYYSALPKNVQTIQNNVLSKSYAMNSALSLASGAVGYESVDLNKIQLEIKAMENYSQQLEAKHPRNNQFVAHYSEYLNKLKSQVIFPESVIATYEKVSGKAALNTHSSNSFDKKISPIRNSPATELSVTDNYTGNKLEDLPTEGKAVGQAAVVYEIETIYTKEQNLFDRITNRYMQIYQRKELLE